MRRGSCPVHNTYIENVDDLVDELLRTASEKKIREREEIEEELRLKKKQHDRERDF